MKSLTQFNTLRTRLTLWYVLLLAVATACLHYVEVQAVEIDHMTLE